MRIRQVKPAFWTDVRLAELPAPVRLFYIGCWMQADDGGWFRWDVSQIAFELYGFEPRARRERNVTSYGDALVARGRLVLFPCGHAQVPKLIDHQHLSRPDKRVYTFQREHEKDCTRVSPRVPAETRRSPAGGEGKGKEGEGIGGEGKGMDARTNDDERSALLVAFRRQGLPVDVA